MPKILINLEIDYEELMPSMTVTTLPDESGEFLVARMSLIPLR